MEDVRLAARAGSDAAAAEEDAATKSGDESGDWRRSDKDLAKKHRSKGKPFLNPTLSSDWEFSLSANDFRPCE